MNNSSTLSSSVAPSMSSSSKSDHLNNKNKDTADSPITINEEVILTKQQHHVLKIICDTYEIPISEYMQQALVEAMRFDVEEGNLSDALLEKIGSEDSKKDKSLASLTSLTPDLMKSDLDLLKKLQTEI